jgi:glycosyltransferase involved in cell wall biosynthesis
MIVHTPAMSWVARAAAAGLVSKTLYFSHGLPFAPEQPAVIRLSYRCVEQFMARYTDGLIVINSDDAEMCRRVRLTRRSGHWYYVPGVGVDSSAFDIDVDKSDSQAHPPLRGDRPMVLYLGRFICSKRPGDVLELARRIGDKVDFVMAGEGPLWLRIKIEANRIGSYVKILEFTHEPCKLIRQCTLAVMPSVYREGLPRFILEAFAAGKPVVAYNVRGVRDIIDDEVNGRLLPPGDVDGFCDAVASLIKDPALCGAMGLRGREKVQRAFSLEQSVTAALHAIDDTLGKADLRPADEFK